MFTQTVVFYCHSKPIPLSIEDYLLGVSDVSGELMRFAISVASQLGRRHKVAEICHFVRGCSASKLFICLK